jgi:hypothetical protein
LLEIVRAENPELEEAFKAEYERHSSSGVHYSEESVRELTRVARTYSHYGLSSQSQSSQHYLSRHDVTGGSWRQQQPQASSPLDVSEQQQQQTETERLTAEKQKLMQRIDELKRQIENPGLCNACVTCMAPLSYVFVHGDTAHAGLCEECMHKFKNAHRFSPRRDETKYQCPVCRQKSWLLRVFS